MIPFRKLLLTSHVTFSVGWLGSVIAYLVLAITGLKSQDAATVRGAYLSMELIAWYVILPLSLIALASGFVQAFTTKWGLFRYYWVATKFVLTVIANIVLLVHIKSVTQMASVARDSFLSPGDFQMQRLQLLVHAAGGLAVLLTITAISIYKPWGLTPYGRRKLGGT